MGFDVGLTADAVHHRAHTSAVRKHWPVHRVYALLRLRPLGHSVKGGLPSREFAFMLSLKASNDPLLFRFEGALQSDEPITPALHALSPAHLVLHERNRVIVGCSVFLRQNRD